MTDQVTLAFTESMMLDRLRIEMAREPEQPDPDRHSAYQQEDLARAHNDWSTAVAAWRILLGRMLVDTALEQTDPGDMPRREVEDACPNCGQVALREIYDIGSGPELSCATCEWCWGADGQLLQVQGRFPEVERPPT